MLQGLETVTGPLAALDEPLRRRMYLFIRDAGRPVTRDEAAAHAGISRKLAAFHLERLLDAGLLVAGSVKTAPDVRRGRGRVPKTYEPSPLELEVSIPERRYELAGELLVEAVETCEPDEAPADAARRAARARGEELGAGARDRRPGARRRRVLALLGRQGFEPFERPDGSVVLRSCPFDALARIAPELLCGMNQAFLDGLLVGVDDRTTEAVLDPGPGRCCVWLRPDDARDQEGATP